MNTHIAEMDWVQETHRTEISLQMYRLTISERIDTNINGMNFPSVKIQINSLLGLVKTGELE